MAEFRKRFEPVEMSYPALESNGLRNLTFYSAALQGRGDVSLWVPEECVGLSGVPVVVLLAWGVWEPLVVVSAGRGACDRRGG